MKKFFISFFSVFTILFGVDRLLGSVLDNVYSKQYTDPVIYAQNGGNGEDVVVFGSSKCHCNYNPEIIEDITGLSCHNYGIEGQTIFMDYFLIDALLNHSKTKPKLVVVDITHFDFIDYPTYNLEKIRPLYRMYYKSTVARELVRECGKTEDMLVRMSKLYSYNPDIKKILIRASENGSINGFAPKTGIWKEPLVIINDDYYPDFFELKISYIQKVINLCKKKNVRLLFSITPVFQNFMCTVKWRAKLLEIAGNENVPVIDMYQDEQFLNHQEWFWDQFHCNSEGASRFSEIFGEKIKCYLY